LSSSDRHARGWHPGSERSLDLVQTSFDFNGPQGINLLSLKQLDALQKRGMWASRKIEEHEGETLPDLQENFQKKKAKTMEEDTDESTIFIPTYTLTRE